MWNFKEEKLKKKRRQQKYSKSVLFSIVVFVSSILSGRNSKKSWEQAGRNEENVANKRRGRRNFSLFPRASIDNRTEKRRTKFHFLFVELDSKISLRASVSKLHQNFTGLVSEKRRRKGKAFVVHNWRGWFSSTCLSLGRFQSRSLCSLQSSKRRDIFYTIVSNPHSLPFYLLHGIRSRDKRTRIIIKTKRVKKLKNKKEETLVDSPGRSRSVENR